MPGTGFAEMALAAARLWQGGDHSEIEHLEIRAPLLVAEAPSKIVRFAIDVSDGSFVIRSRDQGGTDWTLHATGRIPPAPGGALQPSPVIELGIEICPDIRPAHRDVADTRDSHERLERDNNLRIAAARKHLV